MITMTMAMIGIFDKKRILGKVGISMAGLVWWVVDCWCGIRDGCVGIDVWVGVGWCVGWCS